MSSEFFKWLPLIILLSLGGLGILNLIWAVWPAPAAKMARVFKGLMGGGLVLLAGLGGSLWFIAFRPAYIWPFWDKSPETLFITLRPVSSFSEEARVWADGHIIWGYAGHLYEGYLTDAQLESLMRQGDFARAAGPVSVDIPQALISVQALDGKHECAVRDQGDPQCLALYDALRSGAGANGTPYTGATRFVQVHKLTYTKDCKNIIVWPSTQMGFALHAVAGRGYWATGQAAQALIPLGQQLNFVGCVQEGSELYSLSFHPPVSQP